jgi:hypothetical protein
MSTFVRLNRRVTSVERLFAHRAFGGLETASKEVRASTGYSGFHEGKWSGLGGRLFGIERLVE